MFDSRKQQKERAKAITEAENDGVGCREASDPVRGSGSQQRNLKVEEEARGKGRIKKYWQRDESATRHSGRQGRVEKIAWRGGKVGRGGESGGRE